MSLYKQLAGMTLDDFRKWALDLGVATKVAHSNEIDGQLNAIQEFQTMFWETEIV